MKKYEFILFIITSVIITYVFGMLGIPTFANETNQSSGGYTIEGVPNEHQIDSNVAYFYLYELPGQTDQIKVNLINQSDQEKTLQVKVTNGNTNSNGLIDYTGKIEDHDSLEIPMTSILKSQKEKIKVPAKSEVIATLDLKMPEKEQTGIILGGIVVSDVTEKEETSQLSVGNTYSYTLGVVLTNKKENTMSVNKNVDLKLEKVEAKLVSGKKVVQADILNPNPYILEESTVEGEILKENGGEVVQEYKTENVKLAPYSVYPFQFDWKKEELKPGNYVFKGKLKTSEDEWEFSQKFTITAEESKKINDESVFKIQIPTWLVWGLYLSVMLSIGTILFLLFKGGKNEK
ncbi:DUF916 and DUF3324 domain-containing protein [Enterococcus faecalis]|uniref:DUF916 and DUF3324 domain-containing protein n=1 Tax=Enterococcus faecalis TaxID=1351 RepID=UPI001F5A0C18|nr:DUF916 and DUF3324 domain-containing protein [Enterococcus faecalis]